MFSIINNLGKKENLQNKKISSECLKVTRMEKCDKS